MFFTTLSPFKVNLNKPTLSKIDLILSKKYDFLCGKIFVKKLSYCKIKEINFKLKPKPWLKKNQIDKFTATIIICYVCI